MTAQKDIIICLAKTQWNNRGDEIKPRSMTTYKIMWSRSKKAKNA